ncbi:hypothetical protein [Flagellimonas zhangzhouensis]|uniref:hypothetical protein n=1 Tax=Flagellimonas zhangzhouensis TaxID=1073328 RepID=UPI002683AE82|nr:hypothetical protein [Allomuricauda zhangzhouensis]
MKQFSALFIAIALLNGCKKKEEKPTFETPEPSTDFVVAFGSCNMPQEPNPFWDDVLAEEPDVWIWGG